jgi:hypothetical protein
VQSPVHSQITHRRNHHDYRSTHSNRRGLSGRHVNISVSPEAQVVAKKLIDIGIAQLPKVATTGKLLASRAISALPQSAQVSAPVLEAEELEVIAAEVRRTEMVDEGMKQWDSDAPVNKKATVKK